MRSDIYFLGCVLYEILAGRPPLDMTRDKHARMNPQRFENVKPLGRDEVQAPPSLFRLVEMMMELNPAHRYQTPAQLLEAIRSVRRELEGLASGQAHSGPRASSSSRATRGCRTPSARSSRSWATASSSPATRPCAFDRFRQHPYDGLVVDARTTDEDGLLFFDRIAAEADRQGISLRRRPHPFPGAGRLGGARQAAARARRS